MLTLHFSATILSRSGTRRTNENYFFQMLSHISPLPYKPRSNSNQFGLISVSSGKNKKKRTKPNSAFPPYLNDHPRCPFFSPFIFIMLYSKQSLSTSVKILEQLHFNPSGAISGKMNPKLHSSCMSIYQLAKLLCTWIYVCLWWQFD